MTLRGCVWRAEKARAHVVYLNGRTESVEKVAVPAAALLERGFSVASLDWRGQGLSDRVTGRPMVGHVGSFADYQLDLKAFLAHPQVADLPGERLLFAHSMGGAIGLRALSTGLLKSRVAILSAPMLGIAMGAGMRILAGITAGVGGLLGRHEKWPPFGNPTTPYLEITSFENNVLTGDRAQFEWMRDTLRAEPALRLGWPSIGWYAAAKREMAALMRMPRPSAKLLILLGSEETVVDAAAVRRFAKRSGAQLSEIPGGRHEVLIESPEARQRAWDDIDTFLAAQGVT